MAKSDPQLKQDVEQELHWDPRVNAAQVDVSVNAGRVSLSGSVDTLAEKWAAQDATNRVVGVRSIVQELTVKILTGHGSSDSDNAAAVQSALKLN